MEIEVLEFIEGAKQARGLVVIIDVFRAFSTACYVLNNGAERIIPVGELEQAYRLKEENPSFILMGEREGRPLPGFDYGNSPTLIERVDFSGKTVVMTTAAGTQGLVNARVAEEIITGSFVNAAAAAAYIRRRKPERLSLVCMGNAGVSPADEDRCYARYISNELQGRENDLAEIKGLLEAQAGRRFFDPANREWSPPGDFERCLALNRFDFVVRAGEELLCNREMLTLRRAAAGRPGK